MNPPNPNKKKFTLNASLKIGLILAITVLAVATPAMIFRIQHGKENHEYPIEPRDIGNPLGVAHVGLSHDNESWEVYQDIGISLTRVDYSWWSVQTNATNWEWESFDNLTRDLTEANISILALLSFDNDAVEQDPIGNQTEHYIAPSDVPRWLEYVNRTLDRYGQNITAWEIWNEANYDIFWRSPGTQEEFFYLFGETVSFIRTHYPHIKILSTSVIDIGFDYFEDMFKAGLMQKVDGISFHSYSTYDEALIYKIWQLQDMCDRYGYTGELWLTETGNPTGGNYLQLTTEDELGGRLLKTVTISIAYGVDKVVWYTFEDSAEINKILEPENSESFFGLVHEDDYHYKSGAYAYKLFTQYCVNSTLSPQKVTVSGVGPKNNVYQFLFQKPDLTSTLIIWGRSGTVHQSSIMVDLDLNEVEGTARIHNLVTGNSTEFENGKLKLTEQPLFITYQAELEAVVSIDVKISLLDTLAYFFIGVGVILAITAPYLKKVKKH